MSSARDTRLRTAGESNQIIAGAGTSKERRALQRELIAPYTRRGRLLTPSAAAWEGLGTTLAALVEDDGVVLRDVRRSFIFDILIARSCRDIGATLVSRNVRDLSRIANVRDLSRIAKVFSFDFLPPYPTPRRRRIRS